MGDERIEELLAKLEKLDPGTWESIRQFAEYQRSATPWNHAMESQLVGWTIQGVIQDAMAKDPSIAYYKADFSHTNQDYHVNIWLDGGFVEGNYAPTYGEAILSAYIAALEAEAAHESE